MKHKKSILLTGASGTVGYQVLKQLVKIPNLKITVFDKESKASVAKLKPFEDDVDLVYGDITNDDDLEKIVYNQDYVIHLAAIIPPTADDNLELAKKVNVEGILNLVELLELHSPDCFFIYSSSISVYGDPLESIPGDEYAVTKIVAEKDFHCGFYEDGDELENILHFRSHSLEGYFEMESEKISSFKNFGASLLKKPIKQYLLKQSEPLMAMEKNDALLKNQFFVE